MKKSFNDYFYDSYLEVSRTGEKPYIIIRSEMGDESTQIHLHRDDVADLIHFLNRMHRHM